MKKTESIVRHISLALMIAMLFSLVTPVINAADPIYRGDIPIVWNKPEDPCFDFWGVFVSGPENSTHENPEFNKDATDMYNKLDEFHHWEPPNKQRLLRATWAQVQGGIKWLKDNADDDDVVVFYYSGHGIRRNDADPASTDEPLNEYRQDNDIPDYGPPAIGPMDEGIYLWGNRDVTDDELGQALGPGDPATGTWKSKRIGIILIFDCCYAGGMVDGGKDPGATLIPYIYIILMSQVRHWVSYGPCGGLTNSVFTAFLLERLSMVKLGDILTAEEMFDYAKPKTINHIAGLPDDDDDEDRQAGEDPFGDANGDGFPGVAGVDDDGDGLTDEDSAGRQPGEPGYTNDLMQDDDEDGRINEDPRDFQTPIKSKNKEWERAPHPVGGIRIPVDMSGLLTPYIRFASAMLVATTLVATAATAIYIKRVNRREKK